MKRILCFGDSNCWGTVAEDHPISTPSRRYEKHVRWTSVLQDCLQDSCEVIEEGLSSRTTIYQIPGEEFKCGEPYLKPCLMTHRPLDLVITMLGGNDLRLCYKADMEHLDYGMSRLIDIIQTCSYAGDGTHPPKILLMAPIDACVPQGRQDFFNDRGGAICIERLKQMASQYEALAREKGCYYLNAGLYAKPDPKDGFHITRETHPVLGRAVAEKAKEILEL